MTYNKDLVEEQSAGVRVIKDDIEYGWYVGCTPTAVAMVAGFYDRNGYSDMMDGDTSSYNENVKDQIGSAEHIANYFTDNPTDASMTNSGHDDNSIADYLMSSRQDIGLSNGSTGFGVASAGFHNYASSRGYDNFETSMKFFDQVTFADMKAEIDAGRPIILDVDSSGNASNDHSVVVFGYDEGKQQLLIHDGWGAEGVLRPIDFTGLKDGHAFGITSVTFVKTPDGPSAFGDVQFTQIVDDGLGSAAVSNGKIIDKTAQSEVSADSGFANNIMLGSASADGAKYYSLFDNGNGTTSMNVSLARGDGSFMHMTLSKDAGLDLKTIGLATADGKTFYNLVDDGSGSAALYEVKQNDKGSFDKKLLSNDSGLSIATDGLATADGKTFYSLFNDGDGKPALYESVLQENGTFSNKLIDANSHLGDKGLGLATWVTEQYASETAPETTPEAKPATEPTPEPTPEAEPNIALDSGAKIYDDVANTTQYLKGETDNDIFVISDDSSNYEWGQTEDGQGIVVWNKQTESHDILEGFQGIKFDNLTVTVEDITGAPQQGINGKIYSDFKDTTQYLSGDAGKDIFKIDGQSKDYAWDKTNDGQGTVVWNKMTEEHDILYDFDEVKFADADVAIG